jgi:hypothetical protein
MEGPCLTSLLSIKRPTSPKQVLCLGLCDIRSRRFKLFPEAKATRSVVKYSGFCPSFHFLVAYQLVALTGEMTLIMVSQRFSSVYRWIC